MSYCCVILVSYRSVKQLAFKYAPPPRVMHLGIARLGFGKNLYVLCCNLLHIW
jgi:hypothetical protein